MKYLRLLRVKHYVKNLLIFLPAMLIGILFEMPEILIIILGGVIFSLSASVIYVINDIRDVESDRKHPTKCKRPIASGVISVRKAKILVVALCSAIIVLCFVGGDFIKMIAIPALYLIINVLYSMGLKNIPLLDITILMLGYLLRLEYGAQLADCGVSIWMFLTMMGAAFFMGFGKRRGELVKNGDISRKSLSAYTEQFLKQGMQISLTMGIIFYSLACADGDSVVAKSGIDLLWSVPVIFIIALRYLMVIERAESDGDPVSVLLSDKVLIFLCTVYFLLVVVLIYVPVF